MVNPRFPQVDVAKLTHASLQFLPSLPKQELSLRQTRFNRLGCKSNNFVTERSGEPQVHPFMSRLGEVPMSGTLRASRAKDIRPGTQMSLTVQAVVA